MTLVILSSAVRVLLVGAVIWLALRIIRVRNAHVEALVWRMVLVAGLALPVLLYWRLAPTFATSLDLPVIATGGTGSAFAPASASSWLTAAAPSAIYLGIVLLLLARLASGLAATWRVSRAARPMATPDDVRITARVRSPATFGAIILLPSDAPAWPADRLDAVLAHERAHVRSRDGFWSWLAQLHAAIFWFSPIAWWLRRRLETLAETTSDDAVIAAHHDPVAYAALLLDFARHPNSRSVAMSVAESNVPERIERLLARTPPAASLPRVAGWASFALLIPVVVFAASTTRATTPSKPETAPATAPAPSPSHAEPGVKLRMAADPDHYYPAIAKDERVQGYAIVEVDVDVLGKLVDARVVDVQPADPRYGFADAALQVARKSAFTNDTRQMASLRFKVLFALSD